MEAYDADSHPLRRLATASWPLFTAFGVRVRVHWMTILLPIAKFLILAQYVPPVEAAAWAVTGTVLLYLVIWSHEMGHIWAGRSVGVQTNRITLSPLGGLAHMAQGAPNPRAEVFISLAGPLTHAIWFVLIGAPYFFFVQGTPAEHSVAAIAVYGFLCLNAALLFFNLLPFWPMDGGRVLRALLAMRMHANHASLLTAYVGCAGAVVLGIAGIAMMIQFERASMVGSVGGPLLFFIGVSNLLACRQLLYSARWDDTGPYESAEPWRQSIPQATWSLEDPTPAEPVAVEERRERRATTEVQPRRRESTRPSARPLQERIDELLDRINEVGGIEKLTDAERKELADASERLRRGDR